MSTFTHDLLGKRKRTNSDNSLEETAPIHHVPVLCPSFDPALRITHGNQPSPTPGFWSAIWFHPDINEVVDTIVGNLRGGNLFRSAWKLMQIGDLQIIYRLSDGVQIPQNYMLTPSAALECAKRLSTRLVEHHSDPYCFLEREIQLRALVSYLSLLRLIDPSKDRKPRLISEVRDLIRSNIGLLQDDLRKSAGTASDKGDCEFMAHYALNLMTDLPGDDSQTAKLASGLLNVCFAAGMAYSYNGQAAIDHLKLAVASIEPKPSEWHADFDRAHHLSMIVLSMSRFEEAGAFRDFRDLCSDLISRLTKKLSDGLKDLEKGAGHGPKQVLGKFVWLFRPGVESSDNRVHMPYGLLYLVGRLVERYISDFGGGEATEDPVIEELRYLLVKEACRSQFREIRTKSYEILFTTLVSPLSVEMLAEHKCRMLVPWETAEDQEWSMKQWDENAKFIVKRRTHVDNYLERLDLEDIWGSRERADKFPQNGPLSGVCIPLTPPQESLVMQRDPSNRLDLTTTNSRPIYYTPQSPLSSVYTVDPLIWKENPKPFNTRDPLVIEPVRNKLKGTPVCVKISRSGKNVSYLSRTHVDVYGINIAKDSRKLAMNKLFGYDLEKNTSDGSTQFTSTALNDQYMAVLTREKLFIIDFSNPLTPSSAVYSDHQKVSRFCSVAVSSAARPTLAALGLVDRENNAIVHIYELQESKQGKKLDAKFHRTLEFGDYVKCPHGDPRGLSFSADGLYVVCTSSLRGDILVWDLASPSRSPKFRAEVPINDGLGFGIAGVTSATMFPDSRYILSTTGASNQPAVITAQSHTPNLAPKLLSIESPRAAIAAGAVARDGNAYALLAPNGGKVFVSRLVAGGTMGYQADSKPAEKLVEVGGNFVCGDVGFGEVGIGEKEVLVAAFVVNPRLKMGYFAEVRAFGF